MYYVGPYGPKPTAYFLKPVGYWLNILSVLFFQYRACGGAARA